MLTEQEREQLIRWHRRGWTDLQIAVAFGDDDWSRHRVLYCRRQLNLPHNGYNRRRRKVERATYAARHGWAHLMGSVEYIEVEGRGKRLKLEVGGHDLPRRQVDILSLLRDRGPQTREELGQPRHYGPWDNLGRLLSLGLVERRVIKRGLRRVCLYGLTEAAGVHERDNRPDGIDRRMKKPEAYR